MEEEEGKKRATTHITVSPDVVFAFTGEERQKWLAAPKLTYTGLSQRVPPEDVLALWGIYVDDYLSVGPYDIVTSFLEHLRAIGRPLIQYI